MAEHRSILGNYRETPTNRRNNGLKSDRLLAIADPSSTFKVQNPDPNAKRWTNGRTTYRENSQPIRTEARYDERGRLVLQKDYFASATP
jgi:hypothetical protein